jgi:uncharacterized protein (DUF1499 family)
VISKIFKILAAALIALSLAFGVLMFFKAKRSQSMIPNVGIENNQLKVCPDKPNCISSFSEPGTSHYYPPIETDNIEVTWDNLNMFLSDGNFKIVTSNERYIHATSQTALLGFVDDLEFLLDENGNKIYIRSASRVGYSDMGKNKKRMDKITKELLK